MRMTRTNQEITVAQEVIQSLINWCGRRNRKTITITELNSTIVTLELEKIGHQRITSTKEGREFMAKFEVTT